MTEPNAVERATASSGRPQPVSGVLVLVGTPIGNLDDLSPRAVATLADGPLGAGWHTVALPGGRLAPGLYVLDLRAGAGRRTASLVVLP